MKTIMNAIKKYWIILMCTVLMWVVVIEQALVEYVPKYREYYVRVMSIYREDAGFWIHWSLLLIAAVLLTVAVVKLLKQKEIKA